MKKQNIKTALADKASEQIALVLARIWIGSRDRFVWIMQWLTKRLSARSLKILSVVAVLSCATLFGSIIIRAITQAAPIAVPRHIQVVFANRPTIPTARSDVELEKVLNKLQQLRATDSAGYKRYIQRHPGFQDTLNQLQR